MGAGRGKEPTLAGEGARGDEEEAPTVASGRVNIPRRSPLPSFDAASAAPSAAPDSDPAAASAAEPGSAGASAAEPGSAAAAATSSSDAAPRAARPVTAGDPSATANTVIESIRPGDVRYGRDLAHQPVEVANTLIREASSADEVLLEDELARTYRLSTFTLIVGAVCTVGLFFMDGHPEALPVAVVGMLIFMVTNAGLRWLSVSPERFQPVPVALCWIFGAWGLYGMVIFFGGFSSALISTSVGIYFAGLGSSFGVALATYIAVASGHALIALALICGWMVDPGVVSSRAMGGFEMAVGAVLLQALFAGIFLACAPLAADHPRSSRAIAFRDPFDGAARAPPRRRPPGAPPGHAAERPRTL